MPSIPLIKGDKADKNTDYRDALPVNYYAVIREIKDDQGYMLNYYGLTELAQGAGISRGAIWVSGISFSGEYRVSGNQLIRVEVDKSITDLGVIGGTSQCSMTYSLNNLAIVSDKKLYYYNPTDGLRQITSNVDNIIDIEWADFRFIATDGEYLFQSSELDEEIFSLLAFTGSDFQPDGIVGVGLDEDNELVAFNKQSTESFYNAGAENFTYTRIPSKAIKSGIVGTHAKAEHKDQWFVLSRRVNTQPQFSIMQSGSVESITTREIEKVLATYTADQLATTVIEVFTKDAVTWMVAHLPDLTLKFNYTVSENYGISAAWSILKTDVLGERTYRGKDCVYNPDLSLWTIGDKRDSTIGYLDDSVCTHYGDIVEGLLYTPALNLRFLSINELRINTIPGNAADKDATVFISRSDDLRVDGNEWIQAYGDNLNYLTKFEVRRLGHVRDFVSFTLRTASRSRMAFCNFEVDAN